MGVLVTEEIAAFLAGMPPLWIELPSMGVLPRPTNGSPGFPAPSSDVMAGIRLLKDRGLPLKLKDHGCHRKQTRDLGNERYVEEDLASSSV